MLARNEARCQKLGGEAYSTFHISWMYDLRRFWDKVEVFNAVIGDSVNVIEGHVWQLSVMTARDAVRIRLTAGAWAGAFDSVHISQMLLYFDWFYSLRVNMNNPASSWWQSCTACQQIEKNKQLTQRKRWIGWICWPGDGTEYSVQLIDWLGRCLTSRDHASGYMRRPCKGLFVAPPPEAQHRRWKTIWKSDTNNVYETFKDYTRLRQLIMGRVTLFSTIAMATLSWFHEQVGSSENCWIPLSHHQSTAEPMPRHWWVALRIPEDKSRG